MTLPSCWPAALLAKAAAAALALPLPTDAGVRIGRNGALGGPQLAESMRGGGGDVPVASLGAFPSLGHEALDELALELGAVSRVAQVKKTPSWPRSWTNFSLF
jgi:hypothetical protein